MNPEIAKEWTARLRSGKYKQAQGYLHTDAGYCCLGVLCEMAVEAGIIKEPQRIEFSACCHGVNGCWRYADQTAGAPEQVRAWASLRTEFGGFFGTRDLASLNDNGSTFTEIADIIDANVEQL